MKYYNKNIISTNCSAKEALLILDTLPDNDSRTLFVVDENKKLLGTVTDGDIRRGLIKDNTLAENIKSFMYTTFKFLHKDKISIDEISKLRELGIELVPILSSEGIIETIIDLTRQKSILPIDAVIMAGGKGERLRPMTDDTPKPLLKIGEKPIIEYNIDLLSKYGVKNIYISIKYLGEKIVDYFQDGSYRGLSIKYINETTALGTLGAVGLVEDFIQDNILVMNSDLLTNIDFEDMYKTFIQSNADLAVACIPYHVNIPYAVLDIQEDKVLALKEKPNLTFYSNAGIYLFKKSVVNLIPKNSFYNATDFMEELIRQNKKVVHYPLLSYWLDIGKPEDFRKAQEDIKHIRLW